MREEERITALYEQMLFAMISKDRAELERIHDESFVLRHITGMEQSREEYISAIADGTLNYYSAQTDDLDMRVIGDSAWLIAKSRVEAAVFGGERREWRLQLKITLRNVGGDWKMVSSRASIY